MRFAATLLLLLASGIAHAQVPADWDQWVAEGLTAEDNAEYKDAEKLFGKACDVSLARALGSEPLTRACLALSRTYAVQGKVEVAASTLDRLMSAVQKLDDRRPLDQVRTLIEAADIDAARGRFGDSSNRLRQAGRLSESIEPIEQALAFRRIASFFVADVQRDTKKQYLLGAMSILEAHPNWEETSFVEAAVLVGRTLRFFDLNKEAGQFLWPAVQSAQRRAAEAHDFDELWRQHSSAVGIIAEALRALKDEDGANRLETMRDGWPTSPQDSGKDVQKPRLVGGAQPRFTRGAKLHQASGAVVLRVEVWPDGRVHNIQVEQALPYGLSWEAVGAIRRWRLQPGTRNGEPVKTSAQIEVTFEYH